MPVRSLLFVPGDAERKLSKADSTAADVLILDLEDSVSATQSTVARKLVRNYLLERPRANRRQRLWVRCKPVQDEGHLADLAAVVEGAPDAFLVPKVRSALDLQAFDHYVAALETQSGLPVGLIQAVPTLTEEPRSLLEAHTFAGGVPRMAGMSWGPIDLMAALGATTNRNVDGSFESLYAWARGITIVTARAAGVQPIDTISADYRDLEKLRAECVLSRTAGFTAKLAIHPDQVAVINDTFTPSDDEVAHARRVVEAFSIQGAGVVGLNGQMLDMPHLRQAREVLARAGLTH
ncbi:HpcH/HpaI aldolase/citrate lyase family protein [Variovorax terrae]|uniref:CoA ester lyase n=1 Tax=Variovorax terrae TaxID=2923278 RepID=A0A9X1VSR4_9BURK|nr:CoA ester lyase [Variovorax terrae]MCJ0762255.1 CoA ester lyase [Variovorax terrae]